ncbi:hypothetical protein [Luteibacter yeojuensis]|uniref:Uncharacterized protein n=1 Tax=Luteibacter yeojuensis TaxID=345309 RepID=A0A0F3KUZ6_9GAMM|nr:hypothetical protein [Luteibacter yeojuensis]KJV34782.1 hypothetical protein VI08_09350 [Luteibacter yeojuensis]
MQLVLDDDSDIPLPLDAPTREAWLVQYGRAELDGGIERLRRRVAERFALSLIECLDTDLKPPTAAQLTFATDIARQLGVSLPAEAIRYRGEAMAFIRRYADLLGERRRRQPPHLPD